MKKTVGRGILYYLFLLLAVISGVACVIGAIMVLSPGTEVFGMCYYVHHDSKEINEVKNGKIQNLITNGDVDKLLVNTNYTNLKIMTKKGAYGARFLLVTKISGIIKKENKVKDVLEYSYNPDTKTLAFDTKFPEMILPFSVQAELTLVVPDTMTNIPFDIEYTTKTGSAFIGIEKDDNYSLTNLSVTAEEKTETTFGTHSNVVGQINIKSPKGTITFNSKLNASKLNITSTSAKIVGGDLKVNDIDLRTEGSSIKIGTVEGNLVYDARKGVLIAKGIKGIFDCTERTVIANITIEDVYGSALLPDAKSSNISITNLYGHALIRTETGNVTIKNAESLVDVETTSGKIDITVNTNTNKISGYNADKGVICLKTESGQIDINFANILKNNYITTDSGTINCNFAKTLNYKIQYTCPRNKPTFTQGISTQNVENNGEVVVGSPSTNLLKLTNATGHTNFADTFALDEE